MRQQNRLNLGQKGTPNIQKRPCMVIDHAASKTKIDIKRQTTKQSKT